MATFNESDRGQFRANDQAMSKNNLRLAVKPADEGTIQQDNATIDTTGATEFSGVVLTDQNGDSITVDFFREEIPDGAVDNFVVLVSDGREALRDAIHTVMNKYEVDPIVTVGGSSADYEVRHVGAATLESVIMDGSAESLSRTAL